MGILSRTFKNETKLRQEECIGLALLRGILLQPTGVLPDWLLGAGGGGGASPESTGTHEQIINSPGGNPS